MSLALHSLILAAFLTAISSAPQPDRTAASTTRPSVAATGREALTLSVGRSGFTLVSSAAHCARRGEAGQNITELQDGHGDVVARFTRTGGAGDALRLIGSTSGAAAAVPPIASEPASQAGTVAGSVIVWRGLDGSETRIDLAPDQPVDLIGEAAAPNANAPQASPAPAEGIVQPLEFALMPVRPNPFAGSAIVRFAVPKPGRISVTVFDLAGRRVATLLDEVRPAGIFELPYRPRQRAAGVYHVRLSYAATDGSIRRQATRAVVMLP